MFCILDNGIIFAIPLFVCCKDKAFAENTKAFAEKYFNFNFVLHFKGVLPWLIEFQNLSRAQG